MIAGQWSWDGKTEDGKSCKDSCMQQAIEQNSTWAASPNNPRVMGAGLEMAQARETATQSWLATVSLQKTVYKHLMKQTPACANADFYNQSDKRKK